MVDPVHFPGSRTYWYGGEFHDWSDGPIHPLTHGLHYGTSVFEGIRVYPTPKGPAVFRLAEHIDRLMFSAAAAKMCSPCARDEIIELIKGTVKANNIETGYVRPLLFFSYGSPGLVPKACPVELAISAWAMGPYLGGDTGRGSKAYIVPWRRIHHTQFNMAAKLGGVYVQSAICGLEALEAGCDDAIFLNMEGRVAEGQGQNIFIVKNGGLATNDRTESILEGITRASLLDLASDLGLSTAVGPITREALFDADEAFFCGTAVEIVPVASVLDASGTGARIGPLSIGAGGAGPVTRELTRAFREAVTGSNAVYEKWLSYVND